MAGAARKLAREVGPRTMPKSSISTVFWTAHSEGR
jgi:hypothetical protein